MILNLTFSKLCKVSTTGSWLRYVELGHLQILTSNGTCLTCTDSGCGTVDLLGKQCESGYFIGNMMKQNILVTISSIEFRVIKWRLPRFHP